MKFLALILAVWSIIQIISLSVLTSSVIPLIVFIVAVGGITISIIENELEAERV